ncbi:MAG: aldo/keto reductase [Woeseia sp.]|jgi:D-threo-aldose 1-dehydrogenase|nr:aldo/keto reductase [Woeseia sp.]
MSSFDRHRIGNTDLAIDELGFGCASLGNLYHAVSDADATDILTTAWSGGFRYFDTAPHYGQGLSERRVGDALRGSNDYILSTKVGRLLRPAGYAAERHAFVSPMPFDIEYDYSYDGVMRSFEDSLQRLGLDRIDILYMHDIGPVTHGDDNDRLFPVAMKGGYQAMDELRQSGRVSAIGLGVNEYQVCEQAMEYGDWDCFLLAGRYTLLEQESLDTFLPKCIDRNCSIIIGGAYNSGILATGVSGKGPWNYDYGPAPEDVVKKVAAIESLCGEFDIPMAAAALQFPLAHPVVASVIPGIGKVSRIDQTLNLFATEIPDEFWSALSERGLIREDAPTPADSRGE